RGRRAHPRILFVVLPIVALLAWWVAPGTETSPPPPEPHAAVAARPLEPADLAHDAAEGLCARPRETGESCGAARELERAIRYAECDHAREAAARLRATGADADERHVLYSVIAQRCGAE